VDITTPIEEDFELQHKSSAMSILSRKQSKNLFVEFGPPTIVEFEPETEEDEEYDGDDDEYQWEDMDDSHRYYEEDDDEDYQERYQAYDDMNNHEEQLEYQPEKVRNLLHERIKDRKLEEKQRNEIHQAINESHNISVIESTETDSDTSSDEEEVAIMMQHQSYRASLDHTTTTRQALVRPIPAARLVDAKVVRSSLEITEMEPATSKSVKRDAMTRSRSKESIQSYSQQLNVLRIFAGNIRQGTGFKTVMVNQNTTAQELVKQAMVKFHIEELESGAANQTEYYATVKGIDGREFWEKCHPPPRSCLTNVYTNFLPTLRYR
jgi:Ras association (RalGDS/AF-6) domain